MENTDTDSDFEPLLCKKAKFCNDKNSALQLCIICRRLVHSDCLTQPKDVDSWLTLLHAAKIRHFQPILQYSSHKSDIPNVKYEQTCRSDFVHKKSLEKIQGCNANLYDDETTEERRSSQRYSDSTSATVYEAKCIFCDKVSKYVKGSRTREKLVQCVDMRADKTSRQCASRYVTEPRTDFEKMTDDRILAASSRELVAAEAHYHKSCYKDYTRTRPLPAVVEYAADSDGIENEYEGTEKVAFEQLFEHIRNDLFPNPRVIKLTDLTIKLEELIRAQGV